MLAGKNTIATIPVSNVEAAKRFYGGTLGLKLADDRMPEAPTYQSGDSRILVYQSQDAGTNQATAATWQVGDDMEEIVRSLQAKGVSFQHYDLPGMTRKGDVHEGGGVEAAWLKDPDGNILALVNG